MKNENILISGASIAGPALAYWLNKYGFKVTVIEKASSLRTGGYRIDIRGKAVDVIEKMNLKDIIQKSSTNVQRSSIMNRSEKTIIDINPSLFGLRTNEDLEIMKGQLTGILCDATVNNMEYIFDTSIESLSSGKDNVKVTFRNGIERKFALVIGAE